MLFPATESNFVMKQARLKGGIRETLWKKFRLRFVLCSRKQDLKANPPGWKKLPSETPRHIRFFQSSPFSLFSFVGDISQMVLDAEEKRRRWSTCNTKILFLAEKDVQNLTEADEEAAISQPNCTEQINVNRDEDLTKFSAQRVEDCPDQAIVALPECNVEKVTKEKINLESSKLYHRSYYHIVPPPPLPKAPSDSWLKRTLSTIPSKNNSFTWLQSLGTDNNHFTKVQSPKWETMVKTSNTQKGFVCFSKETVNSIPESEQDQN